MPQVKLYNLCMIIDTTTDSVVVQNKVNSDWNGYTFPGGHIENGEGITISTIREVEEETGLVVDELKYAGLVNWYNPTTHERWLVFLYKTCIFSGDLIEGTYEGKVSWMRMDELYNIDLAPDMKEYLKLYMNEDLNEAFATWDDNHTSGFDFI